MNNTTKARIEDLDEKEIIKLLEKWEMAEFADFVRVKHLDGFKLLAVSEGIVKLWSPRCNARKFMEFIAQLKLEPQKYLDGINPTNTSNKENNIEAQYQTVNVKKLREQIAMTSIGVGVEDILKKIVPPKSFLYRNQVQRFEKADKQAEKPVTSYTPMDANASNQKKQKRFHFSSYEYPNFNIRNFRLSRQENFNDRGYYSVRTDPRNNEQKVFNTLDCKTKYKPLLTTNDIDKNPEDHFYEDLNYNNMQKKDDFSDLKEINRNVKPAMVKIHELFSALKLPFFKKSEETDVGKEFNIMKNNDTDKNCHIYENSDSITSVYDTVNTMNNQGKIGQQSELEVEEYLEPVQLNKDYCDVAIRPRDDSILGYILSLFDNFSIRRETTEISNDHACEQNAERTSQNVQQVETKEHTDRPKSKMADRPLPVPVENEPYFMHIGRTEAEDLLRGQPDGAFVLRPSTQPNHAYTLTVSCSNAVHNIGIRRRPDGRLSLGFARRGERSFETIAALLRHHKKHRLLLLTNGAICGATILTETPQYYQTPNNLPFLKV